jgi:hypothetical protein
MRRLAEALMLAPAKTPETPEDAGFGGDFLGYAGPAPTPITAPTPPAPKASKVPAETIVIPSSMTAQALAMATRRVDSEDKAPNLEIMRPAVRPPASLVPPNPADRPVPVAPPVVFPPYQSSANKALAPESAPELATAAEIARTPIGQTPPAAPAPIVSAPPIEPAAPITIAPPPATPALPPRSEEKSMQERIAEAALRAQQIAASSTTLPQPPAPIILEAAPAPTVQAEVVSSPAPEPAETTLTPPPAAPLPPLRPTPAIQVPPPPISVPQATPVKVRGPFIERMSRFRDGLHAQFGAKGVFILDKEGSVIFDESDHSRLHFMARSLAMAAKKSNDGPGNVHVKVGSTTMLEVIPVDTVFGRMVLGLLVQQPLSSEAVIRIIQALQSAVAPPQH